MRGTETPEPIWINFCVMVDIADVVTYTNFGDHRLRGFWVPGGQISPSPIDFHRRPYNTLALPCERVIYLLGIKTSNLCRSSQPVHLSVSRRNGDGSGHRQERNSFFYIAEGPVSYQACGILL